MTDVCCFTCQYWASWGDHGHCTALDHEHESVCKIVLSENTPGSPLCFSPLDSIPSQYRAHLVTPKDFGCHGWMRRQGLIEKELPQE